MEKYEAQGIFPALRAFWDHLQGKRAIRPLSGAIRRARFETASIFSRQKEPLGVAFPRFFGIM